MQIFCVTPCGGITSIEVEQSTSIAVVQARLAAKTCIPERQITLTFGGKPLKNSLTLEDYGIKHEATLRLVVVAESPPEFYYKDSLCPTRSVFDSSDLRPGGISVMSPTKVHLHFRDDYVVSRLLMNSERVCVIELPPHFSDLPDELLRHKLDQTGACAMSALRRHPMHGGVACIYGHSLCSAAIEALASEIVKRDVGAPVCIKVRDVIPQFSENHAAGWSQAWCSIRHCCPKTGPFLSEYDVIVCRP